MRKAWLPALCVASILLGSCVPNVSSPSTLVISWSIGSAKTVMPGSYKTPSTYDVSLSCPGFDSIERTGVSGSTLTIDTISPGHWMVAIAGRDELATLIARGSAETDVAASMTNTVAVTMGYLASEGFGRISLTYSWPAGRADGATAHVEKPGGATEDVALTVAANATTYQLDNVPAGAYLVTVTLTLSGNVVYADPQAVNVFAGHESAATFTLANGDFPSPPPVPQGLLTVPNGTGIDLQWTPVPTATHFVIQRKPEAAPDADYATVATVGAVSSYQDRTGLLASTSYTYQVCAQNIVGASSYSDPSTATTLSDDASLSALTLSSGAFSFASSTHSYAITVPFAQSSVTVTATAHTGATFTVNGSSAISGVETTPIPLVSGANSIVVAVTAENGAAQSTYTISVTRLEQLGITITIVAPEDIPVVMAGQVGALVQPQTMTVTTTFTGAESYRWLVQGVTSGTGSSLTVDSMSLAVGGPYRLTLVVYKGVLAYSGSIQFYVYAQ